MIINFSEQKFSSSGREDVDVRMLGNGEHSIDYKDSTHC